MPNKALEIERVPAVTFFAFDVIGYANQFSASFCDSGTRHSTFR